MQAIPQATERFEESRLEVTGRRQRAPIDAQVDYRFCNGVGDAGHNLL